MTTATDPVVAEIACRVRASVGDLATARSMPPEAYTSPTFYDFEREAVFARSWLFLCHESQLAQPGDHLAVTVAGEPLLVVRGTDGHINVMSAVCQHRGYVFDQPDPSSRLLRCPYHAWTYDFDGRLVAAPSMTPAHDLAELRRTISLPRLKVEVWHGLVFANFDPDAPPLAPTVTAAGAAIAPYRLADMVVAETVELPGLPFNWKNMQENALEEYHTTYVHRGYHENVPATLVEHGTFDPGDGAVFRHAGMIIKGGEPVPGRPTFPVIDGLPERERGYFVFFAVPPLLFAAIRPDGVKMFRISPEAVDRMTLTISFLFPPATLELPDFDASMQRQLALIDLLDRPDIESNTRTFRGMHSRFAPRGPYSSQETSLLHFNQWLLERYTSHLADAR